VDRNRVAHLHGMSRAETLLHLNTLPRRFVAALFNPRSLTARAVGTAAGLTSFEDLNREELRVVEIPAGNGIGTARSVAKAYGAAATGEFWSRHDRNHPRRLGHACSTTH
jgi:hypothetical protein